MLVEKKICYWKIIAICLVSFVVGQTYSTISNSTAGVINNNLTATVFEDTMFTENTDQHGTLKLNITWRDPSTDNKGLRRPTSYSVLITSLRKIDDDIDENMCPDDETLFYTTRDENRCYAVLPENKFFSEAPELTIRPTCSYDIRVFANPRINGTLEAPRIVLTIPECVGRWCSCENAKRYLPIPKVDIVAVAFPATTNNYRQIRITWKSTITDRSRLHSYVISFGVPFLVSNNRQAVYNITKIANVTSTVTSYLWFIDTNDLDISTTGGKISVTAQDTRGCFGTPGSALLVLDPSVASSASVDRPVVQRVACEKFQWLVWACLGGLIATILGGIICFLYFGNKNEYKTIRRDNRKRIQEGSMGLSRLRSRLTDSTLKERNVLYVEQEVQDAIDRGDNADEFEVSHDRLKFIRELGKGQFGKVYLGRLLKQGYQDSMLVAIKISNCQDPAASRQAREEFFAEIQTMKNAGIHPHLVRLIATCTALPEKPICLILEYLEGGDLLAHLHRLRDSLNTVGLAYSPPSLTETVYTILPDDDRTPSTVTDFPDFSTDTLCIDDTVAITSKENAGQAYANIHAEKDAVTTVVDHRRDAIDSVYRFDSFALDIARGMQHLESKGIIHRDLAARNILLSTDMTLKISDFGLARNDGVYVIGSSEQGVRRLPIRWMAPEALSDRAFTSKSDVWSFAIVLWEIGTLGAFPYFDIQDDRVLLRHVLRDEGRLRRPSTVSPRLYDIMRSCWASRPINRPNFVEIVEQLLALTVNAASNPCYSLLSAMSATAVPPLSGLPD